MSIILDGVLNFFQQLYIPAVLGVLLRDGTKQSQYLDSQLRPFYCSLVAKKLAKKGSVRRIVAKAIASYISLAARS